MNFLFCRGGIFSGLVAGISLSAMFPSYAGLEITEFLAVNRDSSEDDDGDHSDWIEITNRGSGEIDLDGWHLTDDASAPTRWTFPPKVLAPGERLVVFASDKNRNDPDRALHTNFRLASEGEYLALVRPDGTTVESGFVPSYPRQFPDISYGNDQSIVEIEAIGAGADVKYLVPSTPAFDVQEGLNPNSFIALEFEDSTWTSAQLGLGFAEEEGDAYDSVISPTGELQDALFGAGKTSVYVRVPFSVEDVSSVEAATLNVRYDDGFVAYLNGIPVPVASANAVPTDTLAWDSEATAIHPDSAALETEPFVIDNDLLQNGQNVLSVHGLNQGATSNDFLLDVQLLLSASGSGSGNAAYFEEPTPGTANGKGTGAPGPGVSKVTDTPDPPAPGSDVRLVVTAVIEPASGPVASADLFWRLNYGDETQVPMADDGGGDDAIAGDGTYTATVHAGEVAPGQMLRWRVEAADTSGKRTKKPSYADRLDSAEYYGTVTTDPSLATSQLPVLEMFIENETSADSDRGTRCSVFYGGEFYDNVEINLHGQSTRSFPKKSYDLDFNRGSRFRYAEGERRVKDINLLSNWADKSKMRNTLGYEIMRRAGHPAHFAFPVRVQRNGEFFATADLVEDGDDRYLERAGLSPEGALYKMYNTLDSSRTGAEKKTRREENHSDLDDLIRGIRGTRPTERTYTYAFDHINIPETVNYLAAIAITNNRDHGHKNYYLYRDTTGTGEWAPLVWDIDLCLGRNWRSGPAYFDDAFENNEIDEGPVNPLKNLIYYSSAEFPEFRKMLERRVRTLFDEIIGSDPASGVLDARVAELLAQIDPDGVTSDADLDYAKWRSWGNRNTIVEAAARITEEHLPSRRTLDRRSGLSGIPAPQNPAVAVSFGEIHFDPTQGTTPATPDQRGEYFVIEHDEPEYVDLSGWRITGAVEFTIPPGTVLGGDRPLYVAKDSPGFRSRSHPPSAGEQNFVVGGYQGQLSARGETLNLVRPDGSLADSKTYAGAATPLQKWLRISAVHYHPSEPTSNERSQMADLAASAFEYLEFRNVSPSETLDLSGASITDGVRFTFPAGTTLPPGEKLIVAADPEAFRLRFAGTPVGTGFLGQLDNGGEALQVSDAAGETVLDFRYDDAWQPATDGGGFALAVIDDTADYRTWDLAESWQAALPPSGGSASPLLDGLTFNDVTVTPDGTVTLTYTRDATLLYSYETGAALDGWSGTAADETLISTAGGSETVRAVVPPEAATRTRFVRVRVAVP